jgi:hypothetical protein
MKCTVNNIFGHILIISLTEFIYLHLISLYVILLKILQMLYFILKWKRFIPDLRRIIIRIKLILK